MGDGDGADDSWKPPGSQVECGGQGQYAGVDWTFSH